MSNEQINAFNEIMEYADEYGNVSLYHVSNPFYRNKIFEEGLIPQIGDSYECHYGEKVNDMGAAIFVCIKNEYNSTYDDDRYKIVLTKEELFNLEFKKDNDVELAFYTNKTIPIENLILVYEGTINQDKDWCLEIDKELLIEKKLIENNYEMEIY